MEIDMDKQFLRAENMTIKEALSSEIFYLSGFETLIMDDFSYAIQSLLLSTLHFDNKSLLLKTGNYKQVITASKNNRELITTSLLHLNSKAIQNIALILETNKNISNVILSIDNSQPIKNGILTQLGEICDYTNTELIVVDNSSTHDNLQSYLKARASYIIYSNINSQNQALIIAQRRSLVKTEGISSSFTHNLYKIWQKKLAQREKHIKPMHSFPSPAQS